MSTKQGHFIVIEGLEGAGKSTALQTAQAVLSARVGECLIVREPGGTVTGESIRAILKQHTDEVPMCALTELLLFYAARAQLLDEVIKPTLANGQWVLTDRFELSTWAYQGGGRQINPAQIESLSNICLNGFQPDLTVFLDISPEQGLERARKRGQLDRIEQEDVAFFQRVYDAYHQHLSTLRRVEVIDASQPLDVVQAAIRELLTGYFDAV